MIDVKILDRAQSTPIDKIPKDDIDKVIKAVRKSKKEETTTVDIAMFGSSI
jgi:hypothetical protein